MHHKILILLVSVSLRIVYGFSLIEAEPPKPENSALMARYVLHNIGWAVVSSISVTPAIKSYPYNTILEMCDGIDQKGNGVPYLYVTIFDPFHFNVMADNRCTLIASLGQTDWCQRQDLEVEDPRCARVMLTGRFVRVDNSTEEYSNAIQNMYNKHPKTKHWPDDHHFYISKLDIELITLFDAFGGIKTVNIDDYFNANYDSKLQNNIIQ